MGKMKRDKAGATPAAGVTAQGTAKVVALVV